MDDTHTHCIHMDSRTEDGQLSGHSCTGIELIFVIGLLAKLLLLHLERSGHSLHFEIGARSSDQGSFDKLLL